MVDMECRRHEDIESLLLFTCLSSKDENISSTEVNIP